MWKGCVVSLHITQAQGQPMSEIREAHVVPGWGIEGDRYFLGKGYFSRFHGPSYEITLIESETIEALKREDAELATLQAGDARRNIVTRGVALNHLVQREFRVGSVRLLGKRLCEPCLHLTQVTHPNMLPRLVHRGGLRAQILTAGVIRVGDAIEELDAEQTLLCSGQEKHDVYEDAALSSVPVAVCNVQNSSLPLRRGQVCALYIAYTADTSTYAVNAAHLIAGQGIEGDCTLSRTAIQSTNDNGELDYEVTLIESETIEAIYREKQIFLDVGMTRRNIVTRGCALNHLVQRTFHIGEVLLQGVALYEPSPDLVERIGHGLVVSLIHRGGLSARIVRGGVIQIGDLIGEVCSYEDRFTVSS